MPAGNEHRPAKPPIPDTTSGMRVFFAILAMRETRSLAASMSTPACRYVMPTDEGCHGARAEERRMGSEPERALQPVIVAAAVIVEGGRVLLSQRKPGQHLAGAWELPGGKVEPGEDPRDALARELTEELGITCSVGAPVEVTYHRYPEKAVLLLFFEARRVTGSAEPSAVDVAAVRWAAAGELRDEDFPPADVPVLARVRERLAREVAR